MKKRTFPYGILTGTIIIAAVCFHVLSIREGHDWGGDFAQYIHHARNIVEGRGYAQTGYIVNPHILHLGPPAYPPGLPILLVPVYAIFGLNLYAMKLAIILAMGCSLVGIALFARGRIPRPWVPLLVGAFGFNPFVVGFTGSILSEFPFVLFVTLALYGFHRLNILCTSRKSVVGFAALASLAAAMALMTRTVGVVLIAAIALYDLIQYRRLRWVTLAVILLPIGAYAVQSLLFGGGSGYLNELSDMSLQRVCINLGKWFTGFSGFWNNKFSRSFRIVTTVSVSVAALVGYVKSIRERFSVAELYVPGYTAVVLLFPGSAGTRSALPLLPFILYYAFVGCTWGGNRGTWVRRRLACSILTGCLLITYGAYYRANPPWRGPDSEITFGPTKTESLQIWEFLKTTKPDAICVFFKPRTLALYARRPSLTWQDTENSQELAEYFRSVDVAYVIVGPPIGRANHQARMDVLRKFVEAYRPALRLVLRNDDFDVYQINWDSLSTETSTAPGSNEL